MDRSQSGEVAQYRRQRVCGADLIVAVGGQEQEGDPVDPPGQEAHQVQSGLIGPVQVLDHQQRRLPSRLAAERREHSAEDAARVGTPTQARLQGLGHRRAEQRGDVHQGAQRARRGERVAGPEQNPGAPRTAHLLREAPHDRGLADTGLTAQQHQLSVAEFGLVQAVCEILQYGAAFEKIGHGCPQGGCVVYPNTFSLRIFGPARLHARFGQPEAGAPSKGSSLGVSG
ncbi:hypothetical protein SAFG77S_02935 [Streptomyces afghaniensis]